MKTSDVPHTARPLECEINEGRTELQQLVSQSSTSAVAGMCFVYLLSLDSETTQKPRLFSPAKQIPFLLALLLSTTEPKSPAEFDRQEWNRAVEILNHLFLSYLSLYRPTGRSGEVQNPESNNAHEVAMLSFLHYFNTGLLASVEQVKERIRTYVVPFDGHLKQVVGIGAQEAMDVCTHIADRLQGDIDQLQISARENLDARKQLLARASRERWSSDELDRVVDAEGHAARAMKVFEGVRRLGLVSLDELRGRFPIVADVFWREFTIGRGEAPSIRYPTEKCATETRPLIRIDDSESFCLSSNSLFEAILRRSELELLKSSPKDQFLRARDRRLEQETLASMKQLLGAGATYWSNVYETPDSRYEHDIVAMDEHLCLVVEVKATPPSEPFRDAAKAFTRLRDAFRADTGIQRAFDQAIRVVKRLGSGQAVQLFDKDGRDVGQLVPRDSVLPMCLCVTRDNFGPLATNLSLLLEKEDGDAYPWVTNILDLRTLTEAWTCPQI